VIQARWAVAGDTGISPELNVLINNAGMMRTVNLHDRATDLKALTAEVERRILNGPIRMVCSFCCI